MTDVPESRQTETHTHTRTVQLGVFFRIKSRNFKFLPRMR